MPDSHLAEPHRLRRRFQLGLMAAWARLGRDRFTERQFDLVFLDVAVRGLSPAFAGYRLAQITDLHMGHWVTLPRLNGVTELINRQKPDLVALTGDFVSYVVDEIAADLIQGLSRLHAPDGVVAILGNHDHWMGAGRISDILTQSGAVVLRNEVMIIHRSLDPLADPAGGPAQLSIAGLDDVMAKQDDLPRLVSLLPTGHPAVLLAHEPDFADQAAATGRFGLMLSGHSHGGQFVIPRLGAVFRGPMFWKYPLGRYQVGDMVQYTNRGIGTHVLRVRINCPPEITIITLHPA